MKLSAAELENASRVAFIVSEPSCIHKYRVLMIDNIFFTYDSFLLDGIDSWVDVVLCYERDALEHVHDTQEI